MMSITSLPSNMAGSSFWNACNGIASTTMSASRTASAPHRGSAPGTSTWVISAIFCGSPDADNDTRWPVSTPIRAMIGPVWPAPSTAMLLMTAFSLYGVGAQVTVEGTEDLVERLELLGGQRVGEILLDRAGVRRGRAAE